MQITRPNFLVLILLDSTHCNYIIYYVINVGNVNAIQTRCRHEMYLQYGFKKKSCQVRCTYLLCCNLQYRRCRTSFSVGTVIDLHILQMLNLNSKIIDKQLFIIKNRLTKLKVLTKCRSNFLAIKIILVIIFKVVFFPFPNFFLNILTRGKMGHHCTLKTIEFFEKNV